MAVLKMFGIDKSRNFLKEVSALAKFRGHPGVVNVDGYFRDDTGIFMQMRHYPNGTLQDFVAGAVAHLVGACPTANAEGYGSIGKGLDKTRV